MSAMTVAIKVKVDDGQWFLLAEGVHDRPGLVDGWLELARDIFPGKEIHVVDDAANPPSAGTTLH